MPTLDGRVRLGLQLLTVVLTPVLGLEAVRQALAAPSGVELDCSPPASTGDVATASRALVCHPRAGGAYDRHFKTWLELVVMPPGAGWQASLTSGEPIAARSVKDDEGRTVLVVERSSDPLRPLEPFTWGAGARLVLLHAGSLATTPTVSDWKAHLVDAPMDSRAAQKRRERRHVVAWILFVVALLPAAATLIFEERELDAATLTDRLVRRCVDNAVAHFRRRDGKIARAMLKDVMFDSAGPDQIVPPQAGGKRDTVRQLLFLGASEAFVRRLGGVLDEIHRRLDQAVDASDAIKAAGAGPPLSPATEGPGDRGTRA